MSNYKDLSAIELRKMLLDNTIDVALMDLDEYEKLFGYEIKLDEPNDVVLDFCNKGLKQDKYYDTDVQKPLYKSILKKHRARSKAAIETTKGFHGKPKRLIVAIAIIILTLSLIAVTSAALGYNLVDMILNAINSPDNKSSYSDTDEILWNDGTRVYSSMNELIETEKLDILYPTILPNGYVFNDFRVDDYGAGLEIRAFALKPFIEFHVFISVNQPIEPLYKLNGIEYSVFEHEGRFQAEWNYNGDYYQIVADSEITLFEIINNLTED